MAGLKKQEKLNKFLVYVLSRRPDEFGLAPDTQGWVPIKTLLQALSEEEGWRHVRHAHLKEVVLSLPNASIELSDTRVRSKHWLVPDQNRQAKELPKLLFFCVRKKAWPVVHCDGISPMGSPMVVLARDKDLALRMGQRKDKAPAVLTVNTRMCTDKGVVFFNKGELLFAAEHIPADCFTGPPLPKEPPRVKAKPAPEIPAQDPSKTYGTFAPDLDEIRENPVPKGRKGKQKRGWKEDARAMRRKGRIR